MSQAPSPLGRIVLYVRDLGKSAAFYEAQFGFTASREENDRIVELAGPAGSASIMLHQAAKSQKQGQSTVKLVFDVEDVTAFIALAAKRGLIFGTLHKGEDYHFANAKDPDGNSISVSSRVFRRKR